MKLRTTYFNARTLLSQTLRRFYYSEEEKLLLGRSLSAMIRSGGVRSLKDAEFKVFSQWGDDGLIQFLVSALDVANEYFVEFGVEDYRESNTRFLMMNNNWSGMVMDASPKNIDKIVHSEYFWKYDLKATCAFIRRGNINELLAEAGVAGKIGLLHIDIDGNDYWIWEAISVTEPVIVIVEYNSVFGVDRAITIPYQETFARTTAHFSNLFYGASLRALGHLAGKKGYAFVGCNSAGNNAYFVRRDKLNQRVGEIPLEEGFVRSKFRESRGKGGELTYLSGDDRIRAIRGLTVFNVLTDTAEVL